VKTPGEDFEYAGRDTTIRPDDLLVVAGDGELLERFSQRP
jgi:trk system potassium uptake protein TrkA